MLWFSEYHFKLFIISALSPTKQQNFRLIQIEGTWNDDLHEAQMMISIFDRIENSE